MPKPRISVVLATYNRRPLLERVLRAYQQQEREDIDFELVVVDDGSTDDTREFLSTWRPAEYSLRYASQENGGQGRARNRALRLASGEIVLFTGDDIVPSPTFVLRHWEAHRTARDASCVFVGLSRWPEDIEITSTMRHVIGVGAQQFSYYHFKDGAEYDFRHFYTSNVSIQRETLDLEPPYFSTGFPKYGFEDVELSYRLAFHGVRIFYLAAAEAYHYHTYDARSFLARQIACGEMGAVLYRKFPELARWVGIDRVEWVRLQTAAASHAQRSNLAAMANALDALEWRSFSLASFYEHLYIPPLDPLLMALFDYGLARGLALSLCGRDEGSLVSAALFKGGVAPAVSAFVREVRRRQVPFPALDVAVLEHHVA